MKFACKLYEGLGHLNCEPLLFDRCEALLDKAEALYEKHSDILSPYLKLRFIIKKSSFLKKFGFFNDSLALLDTLEQELIDRLKHA